MDAAGDYGRCCRFTQRAGSATRDTPYKFATFENAGNGTVEVNTVEAWKDAVTKAADAADNATANSVPAEYANNPAAYRGHLQRGAAPASSPKSWPRPTRCLPPMAQGLTVTTDQAGHDPVPVAVNGEGWYAG